MIYRVLSILFEVKASEEPQFNKLYSTYESTAHFSRGAVFIHLPHIHIPFLEIENLVYSSPTGYVTGWSVHQNYPQELRSLGPVVCSRLQPSQMRMRPPATSILKARTNRVASKRSQPKSDIRMTSSVILDARSVELVVFCDDLLISISGRSTAYAASK